MKFRNIVPILFGGREEIKKTFKFARKLKLNNNYSEINLGESGEAI